MDPSEMRETSTEPSTATSSSSAASKRRLPRAQEVRRVGVSGDYWYPAHLSRNLRKGAVLEVKFWGDSIALFRGEDGVARAVENRCAHRQLALTKGVVKGDTITCQYHGWQYDGCGKCVSMDHELGKNRSQLPKIQIRSYPVKERYGLLWFFPGDPDKAETTPLPEVPQLSGSKPWPVVPIEIDIKAHFSMIVENVCDFNHAFLHRRKQPFTQPRLNRHYREGETIHVLYDTSFHQSRISKLLADQSDLDQIHLWYQYPYQGSDIGGKYLHWLFMLPEDERTTRCFFFFLFGPIQIPLTTLNIPDMLKGPILKLVNKLYIRPLLGEDQWALEAEQEGFDKHHQNPFYELNPIVPEFQALTIERYATYQEESLRRSLRKERVNTAPLASAASNPAASNSVSSNPVPSTSAPAAE